MLFQEYFNKYLEFISAKLKPQSIKSIKTRYFGYIYPYFKDLDINNITELVYLKWQNQLNNNNFKYAYKKSLHYTMVAFYNYLDLFYNYNRNIPKRVGNFSNNDLPTDISILNIEEFNTLGISLFIKNYNIETLNEDGKPNVMSQFLVTILAEVRPLLTLT